MRVLIIGCGYVGQALGAELVREGHEVCGLKLSSARPLVGESKGVRFVNADVTIPASLPDWGPGYDWVVYCVSAKGGGAARYEQVYFHGMRHVLDWVSSSPPAKIVYTSSTSIYGQLDGNWVDETTPAAPASPMAQILLRTEELLLNSARQMAAPAVILRLAGIYGPGRTYWLDQIRSGSAHIDRTVNRYINMIHLQDVVGALLAALLQDAPDQIYNTVDDEPVTEGALLDWLSKRLQLSDSLPLPGQRTSSSKRAPTNKRVCNNRLKTHLGYQFTFPTFREGFASILAG